jgi:hypothetical protein
MKQGLKIMLGWLAGMMCLPLMGQDPYPQAPRGIFSVGPNKYVQFKEMNESKLMQWASIPTEDTYGWRVLTSAEWSYLLVNAAGEGRENANDLNALGRIKTGEDTWRNGLVILPDGWVQPEGVPPFVTVSQAIGYDQNSYTAEQWAIMAASGAAFLPCEGYGYNTPNDEVQVDPETITDDGHHGSYWAADAHSAENAHCMRFNNDENSSGDIHDLNNQTKYAYYSVRLARTVVILDEMDETAAFLTKLPKALTKSFALMRRTLYKDGYFNTICLPFDVPDIEASPLAGAEVYTFDGGTVSGTTGNEQLNLSVSPLAGNRLSAGVPYLIQWANTGEVMTFLRIDGVENWVAEDVSEAPSDPGNENIKFHGLYPRKRIPGYQTGEQAHYNFFVDAENTLLWPDDSLYPDSKMKGFRAYLYLEGGGPDGHNNGPSGAARYRNMPAVWHIQSTATGVDNVQRDKGQCTKVIKNGALFIMYKGTMYDAQGNKVSTK